MKINKKFYIGASGISTSIANGEDAQNTHATLEEAVSAAKKRVESGQSNCEIVVQIVRVIRQKPKPVSVEKVS